MGEIVDYSAFFNWVLGNSLKASVLIVLILLIKFLFRFRIGARVQYLLWFVVVIGLIMPGAPESSFSIYNLVQSDKYKMPNIVEQTPSLNLPGENSPVAEVLSQNKPDSELVSTPTPTPTPSIKGFVTAVNSTPDVIKTLGRGIGTWSINDILFSVWLIVACLLAGLTVFRNRAFSKKLDAKLITDKGLISSLEEMKARLKVRTHIPLVQTSNVTTPSLYGIFRPKLLMPEKVQEKLSLNQMTYVFAHELCHFKSKDVLVNWLINALVILHWFNPVIWYMAYKMREDQEVACDAYALSYIGNDKSNDYGYTLISLLESCTKARHVTGLTSLSGSKSQLKRRVTMLKMLGKASVKWTLLGLVIVIAISFTALTNAEAIVPNTPNQNPVNTTEKQKEIMTVNSVQPAKLQLELVEYAKNNREPAPAAYSFSTSEDLPSIALGAFLGSYDRASFYDKLPTIQKQATELVPGNPIVVKSYDAPFTDYYLIPMFKDSKFVDPIVFSVTYTPGNEENKAVKLYGPTYNGDKMEFTARDKLFDIDGSDAVEIMKRTEGISEVPVPRLVQKGSDPRGFPRFDPQEFLWEFNFGGERLLFVNQQGEVLETDILPWYEKYVSPKYDPKKVKLEPAISTDSNKPLETKFNSAQVEPNKMIRDTWEMSVTKIEFTNLKASKMAAVYFAFTNLSGLDKDCVLEGKIQGILGTSGKLYDVGTDDTLDLVFNYNKSIMKKRAEQRGEPFMPGKFEFAIDIFTDNSEENFTKVIYQDKNGNNVEIPIQGIVPEIITLIPSGNAR